MQPSVITLYRSAAPSRRVRRTFIARLRKAIAAAFMNPDDAERRAVSRQQVYLGL